jgi:hypothetical protein
MDPDFFKNIKTIAIVGLSDNPEKYSYKVAFYLRSKGFKIIPVNPKITKVLGEKAYPDILSIPKGITIDIVDIFRKPEEVIPHLKEVLKRGGVSTVWLQEGVGSAQASAFAKEFGINLISDFCMMEVHKNIK